MDSIETKKERRIMGAKKLEGEMEQCWECSAVGPIENFYTLKRNNKIEYYCDVCIKEIKLS